MKKALLALVGAGLVGSTATVGAIQFTDFDFFDGAPLPTVTLGQTLNTFYADTFNIAAGDGGAGDVFGFSSLAYTINSAVVEFALGITGLSGDPTATVSVDLGADGDIFGSQTIDFATLGINASGNVLVDLANSGAVSYQVNWLGGSDISLEWAGLTAQASPIGGAVPDGGSSLGLLGLALTGLISLRKRLAK